MPSPVLTTVPVSMTSAVLSKFWICFLMICEISSARSCMFFLGEAVWLRCPLSGSELGAELVEARARRTVDHAIADADHDTRQELGVLTAVEHDLLSRHRLQLSLQSLRVRFAERLRAHCGSAKNAGALVGEPVELPGDGGQREEALSFGQEPDRVLGEPGELEPVD